MSVTVGLLDSGNVLRNDEETAVNLANRNFVHVMLELGYEIDPNEGLCGDLDAAELKSRCLLYLNVADDGRELETISERGGRFIDLGQRPGYLKDVARRLYDLAERALADGRAIAYG